MSREPKSELPFAHSVTDVAEEVYMHYLDSQANLIEKIGGDEIPYPHNLLADDLALADLDRNIASWGKNDALNGILLWLSRTSPVPVQTIARAITTGHPLFTQTLTEAETRLVFDRVLDRGIDLNRSMLDENTLAEHYQVPQLVLAEDVAEVYKGWKETLEGFQTKLRERVTPTPPQEKK